MKTIGQIGYEAYGKAADWLTFDGRAMPTWEQLGESDTGRETRRRWEVASSRAALAAMGEVQREGCTCIEIIAADDSRHFRDCPLRALYPGAKALVIAAQPPPAPSSGPAIWPLVLADVTRVRHGDEMLGLALADMRQRHHLGIERYGTPLLAGNGRDALVDAYQEALDLCAYLRQSVEETGHGAAFYSRAIDLVFALRYPILVRAGSRGTAARDAASATVQTEIPDTGARIVPKRPLRDRALALAEDLAAWAAANPNAGDVLVGLGRAWVLLREAAEVRPRLSARLADLRSQLDREVLDAGAVRQALNGLEEVLRG